MGRLVILAAVAALAGGCVNYIDHVHVRVRDPAAVVVAPFAADNDWGVTIARDDLGALAALCAACKVDPARVLVNDGGQITLLGTPGHALVRRRGGDRLYMRFDYEASQPCRHGPCERHAFTLDLDTPRTNVLDLHFDRQVSTAYGELTGAKIGIGAGLIASAMAYLAFGLAVDPHNAAGGRWAAAGAGVGAAGIGGLFLGAGIATLLAKDSVGTVEP